MTKAKNATHEQREAIRLRFPTEGSAQLAIDLGMRPTHVATVACRMGVKVNPDLLAAQRLVNVEKMSQTKRLNRPTHIAKLLELAARPVGVMVSDLSPEGPSSVEYVRILKFIDIELKVKKDGLIRRAGPNEFGQIETRYFLNIEYADSWSRIESRKEAFKARGPRPAKPRVRKSEPKRQKWSEGSTVIPKSKAEPKKFSFADVSNVDDSRAKIIKLETPKPRYWVDPNNVPKVFRLSYEAA